MATLLRAPEVAAGTTDAILAEWLLEEDAAFSAGDPIVVIETEKAVVEVEAEVDAVFLKFLVPGGSAVEVGAPIALIGSEDDRGADVDQLLASLGVNLGDLIPEPAPERREVPEVSVVAAVSERSPEPASIAIDADPARRFVSPIARKMSKDAGIDVNQLEGTGPQGRIVRRDVEKAIARMATESLGALKMPPPQPRSPAPADGPAAGGDYEQITHSRMRRAIANRLTTSKQTVPHFYVKRTARLDRLLDLRAQLNSVSTQRISVNDLIIRAVAAAHVAVPDANVIWTDEGMRKFDRVDISFAVASDRGLVTPVLRSVESSSASAVAAQVRAFVQQANEGKLQQRDLEGGSISVTNLGMFDVDEFSAIINPPQSAILAVGAGTPTAVVTDGAVTVATVATLVLSVDHRAIDGALAAKWMKVLVESIEEPLRLVV